MKYDEIDSYVDAMFGGGRSEPPTVVQPEEAPAAPADWDAEIEDLYFRAGFGAEDFGSKPAAQTNGHGNDDGTYYSEPCSGTGAAYHQPAEASISLGAAIGWLVFLGGGLALIVALSEIGWI